MAIFQGIPNLKPSQVADLLVYRMAWQVYPRKSFITGLWLRDFENTEIFLNCFTRVLNKEKYPYFRRYLRNICLCTPAEHSAWENGQEEDQILYSQEVEKQFGGRIKADWQKIKDLAEVLKKEYEINFPYTHKGIVGYNYTLQEQLDIIARLNKKYLSEIKN